MTDRTILLRVFSCAVASLTFTFESDASPIAPVSAVSRKIHSFAGTFDVALPLTGNPGIECRSGGGSNDYQIVVSFAAPVTFSGASVLSGSASVASSSVDGSTLTVNLTGVTNAQRVVVSILDVSDGVRTNDVMIQMSVLIGDTTANGIVNSSDIAQTQSCSGQELSSANFRCDVTVNGLVNSSDIAFVQSKSGSAIPCSEPVLFVVSGDSQSAAPNTFLSEALVAQVTCETGDLLVNVPVTFTTDHGAFSDSSDAQTSSELTLYTDQNGLANVYFLTPNQPGLCTIAATAEFNGATDSIHFSETTLEPTVPSSGLKLWLRADTGITKDANNLVSRWADLSGNGNDAAQAIPGNSPVFVANGLVGKPVIRFNGSTAAMSGPLSLGTQVSIFVVAARGTANPLSKVILTNSGHFYFGTDDNGDFTTRYGNGSLIGGGSHPFVLPPNQFNFLEAINDGTDKAYVNGKLIDSRPGAMGAFSSGFELGRDPLGSLYWDGDVIEVLIYDHALSDADRQFVETYLNWKYNGDTDGDGMPDLWELRYGLNPEVNDASLDFDGDGRTNLQEYLYGTDPLDYYNGGIPLPRFHSRSRGLTSGKVGFSTFRVSNPPRFYLQQVDTSSIDGANPESQVGGVITTTVDNLNTGHTSETRSGKPFQFDLVYWDFSLTYANNDTTRIEAEHTQDANEDFEGGPTGAYDDPPNQLEDLAATLTRQIDRTNEYTTAMLVSHAIASMPPLPAIDAPIDPLADDALFAQVTVVANETRAYASHSEYRFEWHMSPSLPALHQVTWQETWTPKSGTMITTVRHWEGTENQTAIYYLEPAGQGRFGVTYFAAQMMVDGNRDGKMSVYDQTVYGPDQTSQSKPYRFWLNDDDDTELGYDENGQAFPAETEQVPPPPNQPDSSKRQIVSKRNLEDFARLWINLGGVESALTSGQVKIALKWKTVDSGTPAINIYPSADGDGSDNYLEDEDAAAAQITGVFNNAISNTNNYQTVDTSGLFIFKPDYWNGLDSNGGKKCFLFEGVNEGKGELQVVFLDSSGNRLGEGSSVWLDLVNVKKMYERGKGTPDSIPNPHESTTTPEIPSIGYIADPNGQQWTYPSVSWTSTTEYIICVHGWNVTYDEARIYFAETTFKRLWQRGYKGRFAAFYWPTLVGDFTFNESEYRAWYYGEALRQYVDSLPADFRKQVAAHSLGNAVVGSALRKEMSVENYAMIDAAVPASCYDGNPALEQGYSVSPDDDNDVTTLNLAYKNKLSAVSANIINFYLESDDALKLWRDNNTLFKPEVFYEAADGDHAYKYYPGNPSAQKLFLTFILSESRILQQQEESLAYAAKSSTNAVGADPNTGGSVSTSVDLSTFGYQNEHGAFWLFNLQKMTPAYDALMESLQVDHNP